LTLAFHSYFSFRYGVFSLQRIIDIAKSAQAERIILCDINYSGAIPDFVKRCKQANITPIAGIDFRNDKDIPLYTGIAKNQNGLEQLNRFLSAHLQNKQDFPPIAPSLEDTIFVYPWKQYAHQSLKKNHFVAYDLSKRDTSRFQQKIKESKRLSFQIQTGLDKSDIELHRNLRAIDKNVLLSQITNIREEEFGYKKTNNKDKSKNEILKNTELIFANCSIEFHFNKVKNKKHFLENKESDLKFLQAIAHEGLSVRYTKSDDKAKQRLTHEIQIIDKLGFTSYFLITWDILQFAKRNKIVHVGRGSGANSIVAYCLGITNVDPIELNLYFERFINPQRSSPPDFDIDFSWKDRRKIQEYIFQKYGNEHVALLGTIIRFKRRNIYRELGKVYGLPKEEIDLYVKDPGKLKNKDAIHHKIYTLAGRLQYFPNNNSVHAGGIIISEESLFRYTALHFPPTGMSTTQWDMFTAEDLGYEKLDILSQRGIGHIQEAVAIIKKNRTIHLDIEDYRKIKNDEGVKSLLRSGQTIGCFYVESPAMQGLIKKLRCENYLTLVAASSIIRPGVAKSGMMQTYIQNYNHPHKVKYLHPELKPLLKETFGVMVYQEDVLKVCHHFAGLELSDADILRRGMSGKYRSKEEFLRIKNKFFDNCKKRKYPTAITHELWRQIESFAGYSFSKAHSASYAVESFQSLFLKTYFPLEFMVAVINNFGGFYPSWLYFYEAKRLGANIELPHINQGEYLTNIQNNTIYIGFVHIKNIDHQWVKSIVSERARNGKYLSFPDFIQRNEIHQESMISLIKLQAFREFGKTPAVLLWEYFAYRPIELAHSSQGSLFPQEEKHFTLPSLDIPLTETAFYELQMLGFPVSMDFFEMLKIRFRGDIMAAQMLKNKEKTLRMLGLLVSIKYVKTKTGEYMTFGYFVDADGNYFDTRHFAKSLKQYPFQGHGIYLLKGKIVEEFGHPGMEVLKMARMPFRKPEI
jgi:DNA polymerase-3 subunit alpha